VYLVPLVLCYRRFDPSHLPFAHHGIMGMASRKDAAPLNFKTLVDVTPTGGQIRYRSDCWCCN
jgi:phenylpropionate dioxygenase-like ring-hydroxylating dioxygenase large terminal subunit